MQPKRSQCAARSRSYLLLLCGGALVAMATIIPLHWPNYYDNLIKNELRMTPDSKTFKVWQNNPVPVYIEFFFFNWTNRDALESEEEFHVPQLAELGPYRFTEKIKRVNVTWNNNNTVTYRQAKYWYFDAEHSKGTLDDEITTLNVVALTAAFTVRDWSYLLRTSTAAGLKTTNQQIHVVRKVRELLFDGYSDPLITMARSMPAFTGVKVPFDKFAWFYKRNGTTFMDGVFNMNTGEEDIEQMGRLENWNYRKDTDYYSGECAEVLGTTGQLFPPKRSKEHRIQMFSPDLCRSLQFEYEDEMTVNGIEGYKYVGGLSMLDNGTVFPDNECYCNGECVPSGVLNVTSCRFGAPAFASFPHYYLADSYFSDNVRGMRPNKEKHQFYLTLEPNTGIPLDVAARFQINLLLQPFQSMEIYSRVPTLFFPMIWFQQRATIPSDLATSLQWLLRLRYLGLVLASAAALLGTVLIGCSIHTWARMSTANRMEMDKEKTEASLYVATAVDSPKTEKNGLNQYIVMKPLVKAKTTAKL